eukprot:6237494-Lingulodinium_polyedra.AAC.1
MAVVTRAARAALDPHRRATIQAIIQAAGNAGLTENLARRVIHNWTTVGAWHQNAEAIEVAPWAALAD